jgi:lipoprotein-anchoring transpeptidase ErfK/SrfK
MRVPRRLVLGVGAVAACAAVSVAQRPRPAFARPASLRPAAAADVDAGERSVLRLQVLLDRARFSPGEIDGRSGSNTQAALAAFQQRRRLAGSGRVDEPTWQALEQDSAPTLTRYVVSEQDLAGPFVDVPEDMMQKAELPQLGYASPLEALGEKFHASPSLLSRLNPAAAFERAGGEITVPNVARERAAKAASVVVDRSDRSVTLVDAQEATLARYPATMGSEMDPLPLGRWKINGVQRMPKFFYNPSLFWDADPGHARATLAPGPNNPVGVVWIDLSKEHYGIHGTPEPATIGKTQSHGCIRLTNWDALELAEAVSPGLPAILQE